MKLFAYCRVSTNDQRDRNTTENQKRIIKRYCKQSNYTIAEWFIDEAISGISTDRPKYLEMLNRLIESDGIICTHLDRFGRSLLEILKGAELIEAMDKSFICTRQNINTSNATGRLQFQILGAFAEFERNMTRERILEGIARAKAEGKHCGRPYKSIPKNKLKHLLDAEIPYTAIGRLYPDPKSGKPMHWETVKRIAMDHELILE